MKTPGGNDGARILMYQPRFGRCIVQHSLDEEFSYQHDCSFQHKA